MTFGDKKSLCGEQKRRKLSERNRLIQVSIIALIGTGIIETSNAKKIDIVQ
jgi:hypothetical protein